MLIVQRMNACIGKAFYRCQIFLVSLKLCYALQLNRVLFLIILSSFFSLFPLSCCSDNCRTSIFDYHRSCSNCYSDLCLICCREICDGHLQGGGEEVVMEYINRGFGYLHGEDSKVILPYELPPGSSSKDSLTSSVGWKANEDGRIVCRCGLGYLDLKCLFPGNWVSELVMRAEDVAQRYEINTAKTPVERCVCFDSSGDIDIASNQLLKAASREDSDDNYLYCPRASDIKEEDLKHFQYHWMRAEPVVVSNVLETGTGLSWEPMVMWRAFRQIKNEKHDTLLDVKAIDCLDWCEVRILFVAINTEDDSHLVECYICFARKGKKSEYLVLIFNLECQYTFRKEKICFLFCGVLLWNTLFSYRNSALIIDWSHYLYGDQLLCSAHCDIV